MEEGIRTTRWSDCDEPQQTLEQIARATTDLQLTTYNLHLTPRKDLHRIIYILYIL